jgi:hypothetical protein
MLHIAIDIHIGMHSVFIVLDRHDIQPHGTVGGMIAIIEFRNLLAHKAAQKQLGGFGDLKLILQKYPVKDVDEDQNNLPCL